MKLHNPVKYNPHEPRRHRDVEYDIQRFIDALSEEGLPEPTLINYRSCLNGFADWLSRETGKPFRARSMTDKQIQLYGDVLRIRGELRGNKSTRSYVHSNRWILRRFQRWVKKHSV